MEPLFNTDQQGPPFLFDREERDVLAAVANWRKQPDSSGALLRLMQAADAWLDKDTSDGK